MERGKAAGGYAPALECGSPSLREGFPAVLDLMARRETRFAPFGRCAQTVSASQSTKRALRARGHELCAARRRICRCRRTPTHGFAGTTVPFVEQHERCCAVGGARGGRLVGRRRSARVPAQRVRATSRSARSRAHADSRRLSERSDRRERSEFRRATALRAAQRSRHAVPTATVGARSGYRPPRRADPLHEAIAATRGPSKFHASIQAPPAWRNCSCRCGGIVL